VLALLLCAPLAAPFACLGMDAPSAGSGHECCGGPGLRARASDCCADLDAPDASAASSRAQAPLPAADLDWGLVQEPGVPAGAPVALPAAWHDPPPPPALRV
jgi:hypothetical protein